MSKEQDINIVRFGPEGEDERRGELIDLMNNCPIPKEELLLNTGLFLTPQTLSRVLYMDHLYKKILNTQGIVMEFGCRWGQNLSLFSSMRGIYEPFNRLRKIVGFDTFSGFVDVSDEDGGEMKKGAYSVTQGYEVYLDKLLKLQEQESPLDHLTKYELVKGDVCETVPQYIKDHPETIVALAYFDLDLYTPTKAVIDAIRDRIPKGAVIAFDEINDPACPGETLALLESFGINNFRIERYQYNARTSYFVYE
ncbi:crotonobetainyl-CoA--carnitine CoA-transferase [Colwellia sp. 39_35_sub15_T18]|nr:crotonobetainyl-CoA--carnitine CoA-transferase [Colwellia sp. 39_35_sub15_T18]